MNVGPPSFLPSASVYGASNSSHRYVGSKDELLVLMPDFAVGAPPEIAERRLNHRRPWLARVPISGPPAGPNEIAWMETALRILRDTGLGWAEKVGIMNLISGYVRYMTLLSQDLERGREGTGLDQAQAEQRYGRSLAKLIEPDRFPEMAQLVASGVFEPSAEHVPDDPAADNDVTFGLERILDGVAAAISRTRRTG